MRLAPLKVCSGDGNRCPNTHRNAGGKCDVHRKVAQQVADALRGSAQERGYDYRWSRFSQQWIADHPLCGMRADMQLHQTHSRCVQRHIMTGEDLVTDHIVPLLQGGAKYDTSNLQTLCRACNSAKDGWARR